MTRLKTLWHAAQLPLLGASFIVVLYAVWGLFVLPPRDTLIDLMKDFIAEYGYLVVFVGAFLESLLLIGWYVPGSLVILLSVILAPTPEAAALSVVIVMLGLWSGYVLDFFLGKYGWYKLLVAFGIKQYIEEAQAKLTRYGVIAIFSSFWSPGLASFTSTAAGVLQYQVFKFLATSAIAVALWGVFWGSAFYFLGERALVLLSWPFVIFVIVVWIAARYIEARRTKLEA